MADDTLRLTGKAHLAPDADQLYDDLAAALMVAAFGAVGARGAFHLGLSGGSTPEPFYTRLVIDPRYRAIPWELTHVWLVDERRVPEDDVRSNLRMIRQTLLDHVPIRKRQVHAIPVLVSDPAKAYEKELRRVLSPPAIPGSAAATPPEPPTPGAPAPEGATGAAPPAEATAAPAPAGSAAPAASIPRKTNSRGARRAAGPVSIPRLDFVLLGMGDDGHTASLFPNSPAIQELERWVVVNEGVGVAPPPRVTMTYPMLNAARQIAILATGAKKAGTIRRIEQKLRQSGADPEQLPITGIQPVDGDLTWYLDAEAAGMESKAEEEG